MMSDGGREIWWSGRSGGQKPVQKWPKTEKTWNFTFLHCVPLLSCFLIIFLTSWNFMFQNFFTHFWKFSHMKMKNVKNFTWHVTLYMLWCPRILWYHENIIWSWIGALKSSLGPLQNPQKGPKMAIFWHVQYDKILIAHCEKHVFYIKFHVWNIFARENFWWHVVKKFFMKFQNFWSWGMWKYDPGTHGPHIRDPREAYN